MKRQRQSEYLKRLIRRMMLLHQMQRKQGKQDKGFAMLIAISMILMISVLIPAYLLMGNIENSTTFYTASSNSGFYAAEAAINLRAETIRNKFLGYNRPNGTSPSGSTPSAQMTACLNNVSGTTGSGDFACQNISLPLSSANANLSGTKTTNNQATTYVQANTYVQENPNNLPPQDPNNPLPTTYPPLITIPTGDLFQGLKAQEYLYRVYSLASRANDSTPMAMLQMDFKSRVIALFQFAVFYQNDLAMFPSPPMTLNGPVATNGNLYIGGNGSGNTLTVKGQVTAVGSMFNYRPDTPTSQPPGTTIINDAAGNPQNLVTKGFAGGTWTSTALSPTLLNATWGSQIKVGFTPVTVPAASFLGTTGQYYQKADIQIRFQPTTTVQVPIIVNVCNQTTNPGNCDAVQATTAGNTNGTLLSEGQLRSLMQPVMVNIRTTGEQTKFCNTANNNSIPPASVTLQTNISTLLGTLTSYTSLTSTQQTTVKNAVYNDISKALQVAIAQQTGTISFLDVSSSASTTLNGINVKDTSGNSTSSTLYNPTFPNAVSSIIAADGNLNVLSSSDQTTLTSTSTGIPKKLSGATLAAIAGIGGDCFLPAPFQLKNQNVTDATSDSSTDQTHEFYNNREQTNIKILEISIQGLTVWNRDGVYVDFDTSTHLPKTTTISGYTIPYVNGSASLSTTAQGGSANQLLFARAAANTSGPDPNAFQYLGLGASDTTDGGLVIHATIDSTNSNFSAAATTKSPYGFALMDGTYLPGPLTFASDQAVYIQGDYNGITFAASPGNPGTTWRLPAAVLSDSLNVLSNACVNPTTHILNCGIPTGGNGQPAKETTIDAAFLAGTDLNSGTSYSGGLENYPRFHEDWQAAGTQCSPGKECLNYLGSFISLGTAQHVSGTWGNQKYNPPYRNWAYDTNFNNFNLLPPLTPDVVYLRQQIFIRNFNRS